MDKDIKFSLGGMHPLNFSLSTYINVKSVIEGHLLHKYSVSFISLIYFPLFHGAVRFGSETRGRFIVRTLSRLHGTAFVALDGF